MHMALKLPNTLGVFMHLHWQQLRSLLSPQIGGGAQQGRSSRCNHHMHLDNAALQGSSSHSRQSRHARHLAHQPAIDRCTVSLPPQQVSLVLPMPPPSHAHPHSSRRPFKAGAASPKSPKSANFKNSKMQPKRALLAAEAIRWVAECRARRA
jgi:hypothetical protein